MITQDVLTRDGVVSMDLTPLKAIRMKCLDCCCWSAAEVKRCEIRDCANWTFRLGKDPSKRGRGNPDHFKKKSDHGGGDVLDSDGSDDADYRDGSAG